MIIAENLVTGRGPGGGPDHVGRLDPARFTTQIEQMEGLEMLPKGKLTPAQVMTTDFLP